MYRWPEELFVALVLAAPLALAVFWGPGSAVGFLLVLGLGMLVGAVLWCGLVVVLTACSTDFSRIDAQVEVIGSLPPAFPDSETRTVLYRVVSPHEYAGKYGIAGTSKSVSEIEARSGRLFVIRPMGKWRHLLKTEPPGAGSVSKGEEFFDYATPAE
jgi:hypothetical protein